MEGAISSSKDDSEITTGDDNSNSEEENNGNENEPSGDTPIDRPGDDNGNENTPVFVTGELLCSSEYDDGLLLSDGTWEYLDKKTGVAVFEFEDGAPQAVYFEDMPQARSVQGWETVVAVAKDADGNVVGTFPGPQEEEVFSEYWELPTGTAALYVQIYNVFVSDVSGEVYAATIAELF